MTRAKYFLTLIVLFSFFSLLSSCKSNAADNSTDETVVDSDTTAVDYDPDFALIDELALSYLHQLEETNDASQEYARILAHRDGYDMVFDHYFQPDFEIDDDIFPVMMSANRDNVVQSFQNDYRNNPLVKKTFDMMREHDGKLIIRYIDKNDKWGALTLQIETIIDFTPSNPEF